MNTADAEATNRHIDKKPLIAAARAAVESAEDAREIAVKKIDEERLANDRQAAIDAQASSQAQADEAMRLKEKAQADAANAQASAADAQANAAKAQAD